MVFAVKAVRKLSPSVWVLELLLSVLWVVGCGPSSEETAEDRHAIDSTYAVPWEEVAVYMKAAPSPVQVALWLRQEKVPFIRAPLHDPTLAGRYGGVQGAANLGIYLTDMAYAHATQNYQDAYEYLSAVNRLAARYGIDDILSVDRVKSLDKLQDQPDSVQKLLTQYYSEVQQRLEDTGQQAMLRHMILGGWIESLHITLLLIERDPSKQRLAEMVALQKSLLPLLVKLYAVDSANHSVSRQILAHLFEIQSSLQNVGAEASSAITQVDKGVIQMQFKSQAVVSPQQIAAVKQPLDKLRQFMIKV